ncbi:MAG: dihydroorotase [Lachnospiraceae bacterium]|nr:dihydroorotase [Lachnospiraceae bacterium]
MKLLIKNGRVIDPASGRDGIFDVLVSDGVIEKVGKNLDIDLCNAAAQAIRNGTKDGKDSGEEAYREIDATGLWVMPGLIDLHVHFREPGFEYKETIKTGALAAAHGGFTTVCVMPNTKPVTDCAETVSYVVNKAKQEAVVNVIPVGAVTIGQAGEERTDVKAMKEAGIGAISEDGKSVMNAELYREAMKEAAGLNIPVFAHCEDKNMVGKGAMNECGKSKEFGVKGITNAVEDVIVARDILLAKETGATLHLCHCSTKDSVFMVKAAKEAGLKVTAEVCPHHFTLTSTDIDRNHGDFKMNPPLREAEDVEALRCGLKDDIMDVISTDHAPHGYDENNQTFDKAPFGIVGLETSVALTITQLVDKGYLTPMQMAQKMSYNPARVLGIDKGSLEEGKIADITLIDAATEYTIDKNTFATMGRNTPFDGWSVRGRAVMTIVGGDIVYDGMPN